MQLFFSYGHDENVPIVETLRRDLEHEGYRVWIDKHDVKSGDDWRREITKGILESDTVFSFASTYSLRQPGVCLDELSIAVGVKGALVQSVLLEPNVTPPASTMFRNAIDMSGWLTHVTDPAFRAWYADWCGRLVGAVEPTRSEVFREYESAPEVVNLRHDENFKAWYGPLLEKVLSTLNDSKVSEYASEIHELRDIMLPDELNAKQRRIEREEYSGRAWLRAMMDEWMTDRHAPRILLITGDPGVGKSSFVAHELLFNERVGAAVYCEWNNPSSNSPERVAMSIAYQLACRYPDYRLLLLKLMREEAKRESFAMRKPSGLAFEQYVVEPLKSAIDGSRPNLMILVDGIDELERMGYRAREGESLASKIAEYARGLPPWVRFVVTCRNSSDALEYFRCARRINIDRMGEGNLGDIREFIGLRLRDLANEEGIQRVLHASDGVFLHAVLLCDEIQNRWIDIDDIPDVPQKLAVAYRRYFDRMFCDSGGLGYGGEASEGICEVLSVLVACGESVPLRTLRFAAEAWGEREMSSFLKRCGHFLLMANDAVTFIHKSIADWLLSPAAGAYQVDQGKGWRALALSCYTQYDNDIRGMNDFELLHLIGCVDDARKSVRFGDERRALYANMLDQLLSDRELGAKLLSQAKNYIDRREYPFAESCARDAIRVFETCVLHNNGAEIDDTRMLGNAYVSLANLMYRLRRHGEARELYESALHTSGALVERNRLEVQLGLAATYSRLSMDCDDIALHRKALELEEEVLREAQERYPSDLGLLFRARNSVGTSYRRLARTETEIKRSLDCLGANYREAVLKTPDKWAEGDVTACNNYGSACILYSDMKDAPWSEKLVSHAEEAFRLGVRIGERACGEDAEPTLTCLSNLGVALFKMGRLGEARLVLRDSDGRFSQSSYVRGNVRWLRNSFLIAILHELLSEEARGQGRLADAREEMETALRAHTTVLEERKRYRAGKLDVKKSTEAVRRCGDALRAMDCLFANE